MDEPRKLSVARAALYVPALAALTAASFAVHTSISAAVLAYNALWRRHQRSGLLRRELGPGVYYPN